MLLRRVPGLSGSRRRGGDCRLNFKFLSSFSFSSFNFPFLIQLPLLAARDRPQLPLLQLPSAAPAAAPSALQLVGSSSSSKQEQQQQPGRSSKMAMRAVRSRQSAAAAAAVGPYARPAAAGAAAAAAAAGRSLVSRPIAVIARSSSSSSSISSSSSSTAGFPLQKKYGQHLLKNPGVLDKIIAAANINSSDVVLEIGPGTGNLTVRLCASAAAVRTLEIDARMAAEVYRRCKGLGFTNLEVEMGDCLKKELGVFDVCAANLPYQISSPFLFKLAAHKHPFRCAVLMLQEEFGERLLAAAGSKNYCRLTVNVNLFLNVSRVCKVDRNSFRPPPKVDSVVVKITPKREVLPVDFYEWNGLLRLCFSRKRKTIRSIFKQPSVLSFLETNHKLFCSLNKKLPYSSSELQQQVAAAAAAAAAADKRSVNLASNDFFLLLLEFHKRHIYFSAAAAAEPDKQKQHGVEEMLLEDFDGDEEDSGDEK
ncbi:dimethyladenosine transferase, putative [Eimeria tenella]|uniref:rRNA adenine N(6)-methyltransferase n=1 Tax=Eimeria tenella TaxID=5802 RepID=U6KT99_EIMTE|nr:dimethyladenosine transferase, putative [Eimeria tenella]CDJ39594.1 dimethyladenosine transferase, putative [Eimeria tenella]|eukprot:XP_013230349.1 dimethyladenosine transferase, putative [Eimeria tenella]